MKKKTSFISKRIRNTTHFSTYGWIGVGEKKNSLLVFFAI